MATDNFGQLWKRLLVYAPEVPLPLAQEFINTAYSRALAYGSWSGLRKETEFIFPGPYTTGTVTTVQESAAVSGSGTTWTTAMEGRQFFIAAGAAYTIEAVTGTTSLTLDRPYGGASLAGQAYTIQKVLVTAPSDMLALRSVRDLENNWKLRLDFKQEQIDAFDAQRTSTGTPWMLATAPPSTAGLIRYELWPRLGAAKTYSVRYLRKPALLAVATDTPIFPISARRELLINGALAELCKWPGSSANKNPFFGIQQHQIYEQSFMTELKICQREDQEIYQTDIEYADDDEACWAPLDAAFLQSHGIAF